MAQLGSSADNPSDFLSETEMMVDQAPSMERSPSADSAAPVAVWVRESSAEGYIEGVIVEWPNNDDGEPSSEVVFVSVRGRMLEVHPDDILEREDDLQRGYASSWRGDRDDLLRSAPILNDAEVLAHVQARLRADKPYTKCGRTLLACHSGGGSGGSGRWLGPSASASEDLRQRISRAPPEAVLLAAAGGGSGVDASTSTTLANANSAFVPPPHPYTEARAASLRCSPLGVGANAADRPQLFVMVGDCGAGKSYTSQLLVHYLTQSSQLLSGSASNSTGSSASGGVAPSLKPLAAPVAALAAVPALLNQFGATPNAPKSSRFGSLLTMYLNEVGSCTGGTIEVVVPLDCSPLDQLGGGGSAGEGSKANPSFSQAAQTYAFPVFHTLASLVAPPLDQFGNPSSSAHATAALSESGEGLKPTIPQAQARWLLASSLHGGIGTKDAPADPSALAAIAEADTEEAQKLLVQTLSLLSAVELTLEDKQAVLDLTSAVFLLARGAPPTVAATLLGLDASSLDSALAEMGDSPSSSSGSSQSSGASLRSSGMASGNHYHDKKNNKKSGGSPHPGALALARVLHRTLFDWLVGCANAAAAPPDATNFRSGRTVSVLDVAGLDTHGCFKSTASSPYGAAVLGFEALVANTAVESLMEFSLASHLLAMSAAATREGCVFPSASSSSSSSPDDASGLDLMPPVHTACASLLLAPPTGLLPSLFASVGSENDNDNSDAALLTQWSTTFPRHNHFEVPSSTSSFSNNSNQKPLLFLVRHTVSSAAQAPGNHSSSLLTYTASGLAARGMESAAPSAARAIDTLPLKLQACVNQAEQPIVRESLDNSGSSEAGDDAPSDPSSVSPLAPLEAALGRISDALTDVRFIVCLKPHSNNNNHGSSRTALTTTRSALASTSMSSRFGGQGGEEGVSLVRQLRACGVTEVLRAHKHGYCCRVASADLAASLVPLLASQVQPTSGELQALTNVLAANSAASNSKVAGAGGSSVTSTEEELVQSTSVSSDDKRAVKSLVSRLLSTELVTTALKNACSSSSSGDDRSGSSDSLDKQPNAQLPWCLGLDSCFLRSSGVDALAALRYTLLQKAATKLQKNIASRGNLIVHEAKLGRAYAESIAGAAFMHGVGSLLFALPGGNGQGDQGDTEDGPQEMVLTPSDAVKKLAQACSQALALEKAEPGAGLFVNVAGARRVADKALAHALSRKLSYDRTVSLAAGAVAQAAGRLASVRAALNGVEQQHHKESAGSGQDDGQQGGGVLVVAVAEPVRKETLNARRHLAEATPCLQAVSNQLASLRNGHALRCAGQQVLESANIPPHMPHVASALDYAMTLLDVHDSNFLGGPESLGPVDLEKDCERAEALGESVNLDLEELLSICEDSVGALLDLAATTGEASSMLAAELQGLLEQHSSLEATVDLLEVRDDPTVAVLLRDCAEATKAAVSHKGGSSSSSGGSLQEVQAASALVATAEETVRRVAEANGEKATFEGVVVPMVAALRRRITLVHQSASPAAAAVRSASSSGFPQAAQEADIAVSGVEALLHQVGQAEACIRLLGGATDAVLSLERVSSACRSQADATDREKANSRRRLQPALDAISRLGKKLELSPGTVGDGAASAYAQAQDAIQAAKTTIDNHGSYASQFTLKHQKASGKASSASNDGSSPALPTVEEEERWAAQSAVALLDRDVDTAVRLVSAAERAYKSESHHKLHLQQETAQASTQIAILEAELHNIELEASRSAPPTSELCLEVTEAAATALAAAPRQLRSCEDLPELRQVVAHCTDKVQAASTHVGLVKEKVNGALRARQNWSAQLVNLQGRCARAETMLREAQRQFHNPSSDQRRNYNNGSGGSSSSGVFSGLSAKLAPLPGEERATRAASDANHALSIANHAVGRPLTAAALRNNLQANQPGANTTTSSDDEEMLSLLSRAEGAVETCEDCSSGLKRDVALVLRASSDAEHMYGFLARQLEGVKERLYQASATWAPSASSSYGGANSSSSLHHSSSPGANAVKMSESAMTTVKRLLLQLRSGLGNQGHQASSDSSSSALASQLNAALRDASAAITSTERTVDDEVAAYALAEEGRTNALTRLGELATHLEGVKAAAEASGKDVTDLVHEDLTAAKEAVNKAAHAIDAVGTTSPEELLAAYHRQQEAKEAAEVASLDGEGGGGGDMSHALVVGGGASSGANTWNGPTSGVNLALMDADSAVAHVATSVKEAVEKATSAGKHLRQLREKARQISESSQVLAERAVRLGVHRSPSCVLVLKALDFAVATALQSAHSSIPEYLRSPDACAEPSHQAAVRLHEAQEVVNAAAASAKQGQQEARACERDLGVWQRRHARCVAQAEKWGSAGDGAVQMAFATTEEALAQGRSAVHAIVWSSSVRHRVTHVKEAVQAEEALLLAERKRQEEAHLDVQRALLALPDLTRRAAMLDASIGVADVAVRELCSQDLSDMHESLVAFQGWLDFRGPDGMLHFAQARDGVVSSLDRCQRAVSEAETACELQSQRVRTAKTEQSAERSRLAALEYKLHQLTASAAKLAASSQSSSSTGVETSLSVFGSSSGKKKEEIGSMKSISDAMGLATSKLARARALVEVPASDWVIMSLMTGARNSNNNSSGYGDNDDDDDADGMVGEGPFAAGAASGGDGFAGLGGYGPSTETAHASVEAAAAALAQAETLVRLGEKRCHGEAAEKSRFDAQVQAASERLSGVLATAHASGVAEWPEVANACEDAEMSLSRVRDLLSSSSIGDDSSSSSSGAYFSGGSVAMARSGLDRALELVEIADGLVTDAWQRHEQRRAERVAAGDLTRDAIARTADAKEAAQVLELGSLPVVSDACAHAERACQAAALSVRQAETLPLAVVTDDARRAVAASEELERVVATQRAAREQFDESERQRVLWKRSAAQQRAAAVSVKADEEQKQVRSLRDQLEAVHMFLARTAPDLKASHSAFEHAHSAIVAAQQQFNGVNGQSVPVAVLSSAVKAAVGAVEKAVSEQATTARAAAAVPQTPTNSSSSPGGGSSSSSSAASGTAADMNASAAAERAEARTSASTSEQVSATSAQVTALNEEMLKASRHVAHQQRTLDLQARILSDTMSGEEKKAALAELSALQTAGA